jgi:hypothetical protein
VLLESTVTTAYYTTSVALTNDVNYSFKVTARNTVGSSLQSVSITILAARVSDAPVNLANVPALTTAY